MVDLDPAPEPASRRIWIEIGIVVAILAAVGTALAVGLGRGDDRSEPPRTSIAPTTTTIPGDRELDLHGVSVFIPDGVLDAPDALRADLRSMPTSHLRAFVPVSPFLALELAEGEMHGPIRLDFPIDDVPLGPDDGDPILLVLVIDGEDVEVVDGVWDPTTRRHRVELDRIADVGVVTWDWERIDTIVDGSIGRLTRDPVTIPDCVPDAGEEPVTGGGGFTWCVRSGDDGPRIVRGRNRTRQVVRVSWDGAQLVDRSDESDIAAVLGEVPGWASSTSLLLGPEGSVEFSVPGDHDAAIAVRHDEDAARATWMMAGADIIAELGRILPAGDEPEAARIVERLDLFCATEVGAAEEIVRTCFDPVRIEKILGEGTGPYLVRLLQPDIIGLRWSAAFGLAEPVIEGHGRSDVRIDRRPPAGGSWPIGDTADDQLLEEAFERDDFPALWSRCDGDLCLAGSVDAIRLYAFDTDHDAWRAHYELPVDVPDPAGQLHALGVAEDRIARLLDA